MKFNEFTLFFRRRERFNLNDPKNKLRCEVCGQNFKHNKLFKLHKMNYSCYMTKKELDDKDKKPLYFSCGTCGNLSTDWRNPACNC